MCGRGMGSNWTRLVLSISDFSKHGLASHAAAESRKDLCSSALLSFHLYQPVSIHILISNQKV